MNVERFTPDFEDDRGTITDLIEEDEMAVTVVVTKKDAVRGNHVHHHTDQWALVLSGTMQFVTDKASLMVVAGNIVHNPAGEPHAWRALEDTVCVVLARGPRAGSNYESDTHRLPEAERLIA